jgi:hypothetical protein
VAAAVFKNSNLTLLCKGQQTLQLMQQFLQLMQQPLQTMQQTLQVNPAAILQLCSRLVDPSASSSF